MPGRHLRKVEVKAKVGFLKKYSTPRPAGGWEVPAEGR